MFRPNPTAPRDDTSLHLPTWEGAPAAGLLASGVPAAADSYGSVPAGTVQCPGAVTSHVASTATAGQLVMPGAQAGEVHG